MHSAGGLPSSCSPGRGPAAVVHTPALPTKHFSGCPCGQCCPGRSLAAHCSPELNTRLCSWHLVLNKMFLDLGFVSCSPCPGHDEPGRCKCELGTGDSAWDPATHLTMCLSSVTARSLVKVDGHGYELYPSTWQAKPQSAGDPVSAIFWSDAIR